MPWYFMLEYFVLLHIMTISESAVLSDLESEVTAVMTKMLHLNMKLTDRRNSIRGLKDCLKCIILKYVKTIKGICNEITA